MQETSRRFALLATSRFVRGNFFDIPLEPSAYDSVLVGFFSL
jgi:hypothetical protein